MQTVTLLGGWKGMKRFSTPLAILTLGVVLLAASGCAAPGASQVQEEPVRDAEPEQSTAAAPSPPAPEPAAVSQPAPVAVVVQEATSGPGKIDSLVKTRFEEAPAI